jgi:hypothetical protein
MSISVHSSSIGYSLAAVAPAPSSSARTSTTLTAASLASLSSPKAGESVKSAPPGAGLFRIESIKSMKSMNTVKERLQQEEAAAAVDDQDDLVNPILQLLFDFCTEPRSSRFAYYWGIFMAWCVMVNLVAVGLQSCDGPNQYEGRENVASYHFLLTKGGYWAVTLVTQIPLVMDDVVRVCLLLCIFAFRENRKLAESLRKDQYASGLLLSDILGVIPFFVYASKMTLGPNSTFFLSMVQLASTGRILRITKDIPAVWAIRIALGRSMPHLVLPFFVFFIFNVTAAVLFYFIEPCYNVQACAWHNLFESAFYSVVTMTTSKYSSCVIAIFLYGLMFVSCIQPVMVIKSHSMRYCGSLAALSWYLVS